ncbi:MAG: hypothetical protein B7Z66_15025 [Chromatiales bacterium 21-64-14]|nr:MAG: hypothetical protein B7Z66_15025 [Chromatiales bacterium 21-64-14]
MTPPTTSPTASMDSEEALMLEPPTKRRPPSGYIDEEEDDDVSPVTSERSLGSGSRQQQQEQLEEDCSVLLEAQKAALVREHQELRSLGISKPAVFWQRVNARVIARTRPVRDIYAGIPRGRLTHAQLQSITFGLVKVFVARALAADGHGDVGYRAGFMFADDMGLGKSRAMVALVLALSRRFDDPGDDDAADDSSGGDNGVSLIVVPLNTWKQWVNELGILHGDDALQCSFVKQVKSVKSAVNGGAQVYSPAVDVVLVSSEMLKHVGAIKWAFDGRFRVVSIDEGHMIKDDKTVTASNAARIHGSTKVLLTATPMANSQRDLANELVWLGFPPDRIDTTSKLAAIKPYCVLQRTYADVGIEKTKLTYVLRNVPPSDELAKIFRALDAFRGRRDAMSIMQIKRQSLFDPATIYVLKQWSKWVREHEDDLPPREDVVDRRSPLAQAMVDDLAASAASAAAAGESAAPKAVVFCHYHHQVSLVCKALCEENIRYEQLTGDQKTDQKDDAIMSFEKGDARVLVANMQCGGVGLNLQFARDVYLLTTDYNPFVEMQAIARVWRMGQERDVRAVVITSPLNEHEARLQQLQYKKIVLAAEVLGDRNEYAAHAGRLSEGKQLFEEDAAANPPTSASKKPLILSPAASGRRRPRPRVIEYDEEGDDEGMAVAAETEAEAEPETEVETEAEVAVTVSDVYVEKKRRAAAAAVARRRRLRIEADASHAAVAPPAPLVPRAGSRPLGGGLLLTAKDRAAIAARVKANTERLLTVPVPVQKRVKVAG